MTECSMKTHSNSQLDGSTQDQHLHTPVVKACISLINLLLLPILFCGCHPRLAIKSAVVVLQGNSALRSATVDVSSADLKGQDLSMSTMPNPPLVVGSTTGDDWLPWQRHVKHSLWMANKLWNLQQHTVEGGILMVPSVIPERYLQWYPNTNKNKAENNPQPREFLYRWSEPTRELVFKTQTAIDNFVELNWKLVLFPQLNWCIGEQRTEVGKTHHIAVNLPKLKES
eukprot:TRINITY_DN67709_c8_g2_i1.p1 TRINITY_DN67709_c8_g2~~TRINITY_DN67709_c8_g2_i1.p1  ORF type:complete len:227 (+),score=17.43 TRINITY_DN67709_c8_g2_i1:191-871(+)